MNDRSLDDSTANAASAEAAFSSQMSNKSDVVGYFDVRLASGAVCAARVQ